jgi:hypothetical protein
MAEQFEATSDGKLLHRVEVCSIPNLGWDDARTVVGDQHI